MNLDVSYNLQDPLFIINSRLVGGANTPHQEMHNAFHLLVISYQITDTFGNCNLYKRSCISLHNRTLQVFKLMILFFLFHYTSKISFTPSLNSIKSYHLACKLYKSHTSLYNSTVFFGSSFVQSIQIRLMRTAISTNNT